MKFIVSSSNLLKHLQKIGGVLNSSNTLPILDNFLFNIQEGNLKITASDLGTTMQSSLAIESKSTGSICIPARLLTDTLKNFPDQPLIFDLSLDDFSVEISSDNGKYKLSGFDPEGFPAFPEIEDASEINFPASVFAKAINKTSFASGNDEMRQVMNGVFVELNADNITFVATDAHKLSRYTRLDIQSPNGTSFIIPSKPLSILKNITGVDQDLIIKYNNTNALFSIGNTILACRFVEGKFPNYQAVIPKETPNVLTIDRNLFLGALKRVANFSNKSTYAVQLSFNGSSLDISTEDLDYSNRAHETLNCNYIGEALSIGFNCKFLIEILNHIDSEEIQLSLKEANRAGLISPSPASSEEDILMLIMPIMV